VKNYWVLELVLTVTLHIYSIIMVLVNASLH
jgi:hypothetical protein